MSRAILPDDIYRVLNGYEDTMRRLSQAVYQPHTAPIEFAAPGASADTNLYRLQQDTLATDDDLWIGGATLRFTLAGARLTFMGGGTVNRYNIDNLNGNFRIYREAADGSGGAVRLSITDAGAVNIPGNLTVGGTFTPTGALTLSGRLSITTPSVGIRIGEGYAKASQQEFLQTWNATDGQDWSLYRPGGTRDLVFYSSELAGNLLTLRGTEVSIARRLYANAPNATAGGASTHYFEAPRNTPSLILGANEIVSGYAATDYVGALRFPGAGVAHGDFAYYPMASDGHFKLWRSPGNVGTTFGDLKVAKLFTAAGIDVLGDNVHLKGAYGSGHLYFGPNATERIYAPSAGTLRVNSALTVDGTLTAITRLTSNHSDGIYGPNGQMITGYDSWLRLNNAGHYSSGLYIPGRGVDITGDLRIGTSIQIGGAGSGGAGVPVIDSNRNHIASSPNQLSRVAMIAGGTNNAGYIDWYTPDGLRQAYMGFNTNGTGVHLQVERGTFSAAGGGRTVDIINTSGVSSFVARTRDMPISKPDVGTDGESGQFWGQIEFVRTDGVQVRPSITPSENVYYEVTATIWVRCWDNSWNRGDLMIDNMGYGFGHRNAVVAHNALYWMAITNTHIFALNKGTTYTFRALFTPASGGWSYLRGPTYSTITGTVVGFW